MKKTTTMMLCLAAACACGDTKITWLADVTADRAETVTGVQSNQIANAVPYTGADRTVNIGNNDLVVSNSVFVGDDVVVDGHLEVDGRIDLIGAGRYITGAYYISGLSLLEGEWQTSDRAVSGAMLYMQQRAAVEESKFYTDYATNAISAKLDIAALRAYHYGSPDIVESPTEWFFFDGAGTITAFDWAEGRENVVIPWEIGGVPVTAIGAYAFLTSSSVSVIAPQTVTTIGNNAFNGCSSLTSVSLPQAQTIGGAAFVNCTSLASVRMGKNAPVQAAGVFQGITPPPTVYVTDPQATGWAATWNGAPVVRPPLYGSNVTAQAITLAGDTITEWPSGGGSVPYADWTGTVTPQNGTASVAYAHGNMPVLVVPNGGGTTRVTVATGTYAATSGVSRVSLSIWAGENTIELLTNEVDYATAPDIPTNRWGTILFRRVSNGKWKGVGL